MKIKYFIVSILFVFFTISTIHAELPYETDHNHTFVLSTGFQWYESTYDKTGNLLTFNYNFKNKFSIGFSTREITEEIPNSTRDPIYYYAPKNTKNEFSQANESVQLLDFGNYKIENSYKNAYIQLNLFELLNINSPIALSFHTAVQFNDITENFVGIVHISKSIKLKTKSTIQPTISIGYRDFSYFSEERKGSFSGSIIYSYQLLKTMSILITPKINKYLEEFNYAIHLGISINSDL